MTVLKTFCSFSFFPFLLSELLWVLQVCLEPFWNIPSPSHIPAQGFFWNLCVYIIEEMRKNYLWVYPYRKLDICYSRETFSPHKWNTRKGYNHHGTLIMYYSCNPSAKSINNSNTYWPWAIYTMENWGRSYVLGVWASVISASSPKDPLGKWKATPN